ncbi:MAG TPA: hypothetical protein VL092_04480 [Chitinophagaceae bacterium]|nr:hypothetical protein [Chitinophagaceae bacterium]
MYGTQGTQIALLWVTKKTGDEKQVEPEHFQTNATLCHPYRNTPPPWPYGKGKTLLRDSRKIAGHRVFRNEMCRIECIRLLGFGLYAAPSFQYESLFPKITGNRVLQTSQLFRLLIKKTYNIMMTIVLFIAALLLFALLYRSIGFFEKI